MAAASVPRFDTLLLTIAAGDTAAALALLERDPRLARMAASVGATRAEASPHFLSAIGHYVYAGDTALHIAAAAHAPDVARRLLALGANPAARNRRGATPLHYAADARPGVPGWNAAAQAETIACLAAAIGNPDLSDRSGVTPLHRAVRTRGAQAVVALLKAGADPERCNGNGSNARDLATRATGRSGSGAPEARAQQAEIQSLLNNR